LIDSRKSFRPEACKRDTGYTSANGAGQSTSSKGSFAMKASPLKVLVLFLVLAFVAITLAGWTWDDNAALSASVPQVSL